MSNYFRSYDPRIGRFLESDAIGLDGGLSTYSYVQSNPTKYYDPNGEFGVLGGLVGFATEVGFQALRYGANFQCYDLIDISLSTLSGAIAGPATSTQGFKKAFSAFKRAKSAKKVRTKRKLKQKVRKWTSRVGIELRNFAAFQASKYVVVEIAKVKLDFRLQDLTRNGSCSNGDDICDN